jgi:predicted nucleic-acid-binding Zn-ribbon protein
MTIKRNLECPNCGDRVFLHFQDKTSGELSRVDVQWCLWWDPGGSGSFEVFVCKSCGFTEWYAHGVSDIRADPDRGIHVIDARAPVSGEPFR